MTEWLSQSHFSRNKDQLKLGGATGIPLNTPKPPYGQPAP